MRILICSKLFFPSQKIGSVRPTYFAFYLKQLGHDVTVLAASDRISKANTKYGNVVSVTNSNFINLIRSWNEKRVHKNESISKSSHKSGLSSITRKDTLFTSIKNTLSELFDLLIDIDWYYAAVNTILKENKRNSFDVVFSTFGPFSSFLLGRKIKKSRIASFWISDFRDNMRNEINYWWQNSLYAYFEKKAFYESDLLTFVSKGQREIFLSNNKIQEYNFNKAIVVYNGFLSKFEQNLIQKKSTNERLTFLYAGQLYSGKRDFNMLFDAMSQLIEEGKLDKNRIRICYAGSSSNVFLQQISKFNILYDVFQDYGFISKEESLLLQKKADVLIALTWNTNSERGILTGKFFEYIQAQKPIVSICCGDLANAELSTIIRDLNLGIACENANYTVDIDLLKKYLFSLYVEFSDKKHIHFQPDYEKINQFHFENSAIVLNRYISMFEKKQ